MRFFIAILILELLCSAFYLKPAFLSAASLNQTLNISAQVPQAQNFNPTPPAAAPTGGPPIQSTASVPAAANFDGIAAPQASVSLLQDGTVVDSVTADVQGNFSLSAKNLDPGNYQFSIYFVDRHGLRSQPHSFSAVLSPGELLDQNNIFLPPSVLTDFSAVKKGSNLNVSGSSAPNSDLKIAISPSGQSLDSKTSSEGFYSAIVNTSFFDKGSFQLSVQAFLQGMLSDQSAPTQFTVGDIDLALPQQQQPTSASGPADINGDSKVNIVDLSILLFYFGKSAPKQLDFDHSGIVGLVDLSILLYHWTG